MRKIVIAGGSGFLGKCLIEHFSSLECVILTRGDSGTEGNTRYVTWDAKTLGPWSIELNGADALVNLNGKSVDCRYTVANKQAIYDTRINATVVLGNAIQQLIDPPAVWINSSSATIYRHAEDRPMDEITGEMGTGFSVDVCQQWERSFNDVDTPSTRKVAIRTALVLGKNGGALRPLRNLAKFGLGGKQGSGNQYFSWIHERDFARAIEFIINHNEIDGAINVSSPYPIKNTEVMTSLRKVAGIPFGLPMPKWLLEIGALIIGTETELILKSRWVVPKKLLEAGFQFQFPKIQDALMELES